VAAAIGPTGPDPAQRSHNFNQKPQTADKTKRPFDWTEDWALSFGVWPQGIDHRPRFWLL
jgi:hypothetical protein